MTHSQLSKHTTQLSLTLNTHLYDIVIMCEERRKKKIKFQHNNTKTKNEAESYHIIPYLTIAASLKVSIRFQLEFHGLGFVCTIQIKVSIQRIQGFHMRFMCFDYYFLTFMFFHFYFMLWVDFFRQITEGWILVLFINKLHHINVPRWLNLTML